MFSVNNPHLREKKLAVQLLVMTYVGIVFCQGPAVTSINVSTAIPKSKSQLGTDYDYVDPGPPIGVSNTKNITTPQDDGPRTKTYKPYQADDGLKKFFEGGAVQSAVPGAVPMGEKYEWLLGRLKTIKRLGAVEQLDALQNQFSNINVTDLYNRVSQRTYGEEGDEMEETGYFYNGTYYRGQEEGEDGYWQNGTLYQGEGPEMDDGYMFNGTWYPGVREGDDGYYVNGTWYQAPGEMEDGYMHNGTWYPGPGEMEDGYINNGTWFPGQEQEEYGQEEENEVEELMWWQLHHPKWSEEGGHKAQQKQPVQDVGYPIPPLVPIPAPGTQKQLPYRPNPQQQPIPRLPQQQPIPRPPQRLPMVQHQQRPPYYPRPQGRTHNSPGVRPAGPSPPRFVENKPLQAMMTGGAGPGQQASGVAPKPEGAPLVYPHPDTPSVKVSSSPMDGYSTSSTMTWGIVIACILGTVFILAPVTCILYKYRQEKRIKKRTFLKRPEHGSVDEGIMDAMIMSDFGEGKNSRVKNIGWRGAREWRGQRSRDFGSRRSSSALSLLLTKSGTELKSLPTTTTMVEMGDGPEILIV